MRQEAVLEQFVPKHLPLGNEENNKKYRLVYLISRLRFEPANTRIQVIRFTD
jgi:hypothetical protein